MFLKLIISVRRISFKGWLLVVNLIAVFLILSRLSKLYIGQHTCISTYMYFPDCFFITLVYVVSTYRELLNFQKPYPFLNSFYWNSINSQEWTKRWFFFFKYNMWCSVRFSNIKKNSNLECYKTFSSQCLSFEFALFSRNLSSIKYFH